MDKKKQYQLELSRVEVYRRVYNSKNLCIEEIVEYYYPLEMGKKTPIGFKLSK